MVRACRFVFSSTQLNFTIQPCHPLQGVGGESVPPPGAPYTVAGGVDSLGQATMFSSGGFGAFGQPAGYGFDFHGAAAGGVNGYSQWGQVPGGASGQFRGPELAAAYQQTAVEERRVPQAEQAMQGLSLQHSTQQVFFPQIVQKIRLQSSDFIISLFLS